MKPYKIIQRRVNLPEHLKDSLESPQPEYHWDITLKGAILDLLAQNNNFSIKDIRGLYRRNNIVPDNIDWIIEIKNPWEEFMRGLMEYMINQNPKLTEDEIRRRLFYVE